MTVTDWLIWNRALRSLRGAGYPAPDREPPRVVRYRWSRSMRCWVEVVLENDVYRDGFTMPDGFVPPEGMR